MQVSTKQPRECASSPVILRLMIAMHKTKSSWKEYLNTDAWQCLYSLLYLTIKERKEATLVHRQPIRLKWGGLTFKVDKPILLQ